MDEIVVGAYNSETARRAVFAAAKLAADTHRPLHLVIAVSPKRSAGEVGPDQWHSDWLTEAEQFLDGLIGELDVSPVTRAIVVKDPAGALCEEATRLGASVIVVGNVRVQGASRVLGSVANGVARHAPCDVLIVNTTGGAGT